MNKLRDYEIYTSRMRKSIYDKMFFVDKIFDENIDTLIDFGCADGELILHLHAFMPNVRFIGYDTSEVMLEKAKDRIPFAELYSNWDDIEVDPSRTIINLSSVIHEIYSYCTQAEIKEFWDRILNTGFAYIVVRDMCKVNYECDITALQQWRKKVTDAGYGKELSDFEKYWGPIKNNNQKTHFLLKYRYAENWDRELRENYMPLTAYELKWRLVGYETMYYDFKPLPFIVDQIGKDLDIDMSLVPTHFYGIFKKKEKTDENINCN